MSTGKIPLLAEDYPEFKQSRKTNLLQNYDPAAYPPNFKFAIQHGLSRKVGKYIAPLENIQRCRCCLQPIYKTYITFYLANYLSAVTFLSYFIVGQALLFFSILLTLNMLLITLPATIVNFTLGNECAITDGVTNFLETICQGSVINIMNVTDLNAMQIEAIIFFVAVFVNIFFIAFLQLKMDLLAMTFTEGKLNAADYSFMVKGLPRDITLSQIQKYVQDKMLYSGAPDLVINKIYIIYNFKNYLNMVQKRQEIAQKNIDLWHQIDKLQAKNLKEVVYTKKQKIRIKKQELQRKTKDNIDNMLRIEEEIVAFEQNTAKIQQRIAQGGALQDQTTRNISNFSGKVIITVNNRRSQQRILSKIQQTLCQRLSYSISDFLGGDKSKIVLSRAPEPDDIIFANMGSKRVIIWRNRILYSLLIFFLLALDFLIVALAKKFIKEQKAVQNGNIIFSFFNSIIVSLFCSLFRRIIRISQEDSYYNTHSKLCYQIISKMILVFMINMLFTTFVANVASFYLIKEDQPTFEGFPLNFQSFLYDCFFLIATNPVFSTFLVFFDHRHIRSIIKRYRINNDSIAVSQGQANRTYQNMNFDICYKYGTMYRFLIFSGAIAILYPIALCICFIAMFVLYWMDKFLLLRRYSINLKINGRFTKMAQTIMTQFPIYLSITTFIVMFIPIQDGRAFTQMGYSKAYYYLAGFALLFSLINYWVGNGWIKTLYRYMLNIKDREQEEEAPEYKYIQNDLQTDYSHNYPYFRVTRLIGRQPSEQIRKQKVDQLRKNQKLGTFDVIKHYMQQNRYS